MLAHHFHLPLPLFLPGARQVAMRMWGGGVLESKGRESSGARERGEIEGAEEEGGEGDEEMGLQ